MRLPFIFDWKGIPICVIILESLLKDNESELIMSLKEYMKNHILFLDGGMGTLLQAKGLKPGESPERWNLSNPEAIIEIHKDYYDAGTNVVNTNTFGANILHFDRSELEEIIKASIENAREAARRSTAPWEKFVALDIGPSGRLLKPYGDLDFEEAVKVFAETVKMGVRYGADLIMIETMNDSYETKAALLAAKENSDLPVFVSNAYSEDGKLMTGANPLAMVAMLEGMGADALGCNCSLGPKQLSGVIDEMLKYSSTPVLFKPNAGLPVDRDGVTCFDVTKDEFADEVMRRIQNGVRIVGGCCGTTPEYIRAIHERACDFTPVEVTKKNICVASSYTGAVLFGEKPILIGERLNPTGKKRLKQALVENDIDYILQEGLKQADAGVDMLDVNVGLPEIDEPAMIKSVVSELQAVTDLPLQIDTSDPVAMEAALRIYNGKAMINSVNGKKEVMEAIFPLAKKYGGFIVALTLDENGIPDTAAGRVDIARRIIATAAQYGISKNNLIFDTLAMTVSADTRAAKTTIEALRIIRNELGVNTSLGVSNISFGLPQRDLINGAFFAMAMQSGLSAAIMNPYSDEMMRAYYSYCALSNMDENCMNYIEYAARYEEKQKSLAAAVSQSSSDSASGNSAAGGTSQNGANNTGTAKDSANESMTELVNAIVRGLKDKAGTLTKQMIEAGSDPLVIVNEEVIPALNIVGEGFEKKKFYLPQLLMSAESAKAAFEVIKANISADSNSGKEKCPVVIATVKGDIHDIGKNIVRLLLENYGFEVYDLGKDVTPEAVVDEVIKVKAPICGLSALMTTTVPAMEETIKLIRQRAPWCKVMVGGAVLTQDYADKIGADGYSKDAMGAVRYAQSIIKK